MISLKKSVLGKRIILTSRTPFQTPDGWMDGWMPLDGRVLRHFRHANSSYIIAEIVYSLVRPMACIK